jgi:hypothetical protein
MPCTTTQNTIGATIIEISLRNASLRIFRLIAKSGVSTPNAMPRSRAISTWTNSDLKIDAGPVLTGAVIGDVMAAVDIGASSAAAFMVRLYQATTMPEGVIRKLLERRTIRAKICRELATDQGRASS